MSKTKTASNGATSINRITEAIQAPATVQMAELRRSRYKITIEGTSPLICHAWSEKAVKQIEDKQQQKTKAPREPKNPAAEFEAAIYRDEQGRACVPARAIKSAVVSAATSLDDKTRYPKTKLRQGLFIVGDLLPIIGPKPTMRTDMVTVGRGSADVRYRPEWKIWSVAFEVEINLSVFSVEEVYNLIELAGFAVGIGEWRPEKDGNNGRFQIKR